MSQAIEAARTALRAARSMRMTLDAYKEHTLVRSETKLIDVSEVFFREWFPKILELSGKEIYAASFQYTFAVPLDDELIRAVKTKTEATLHEFLEMEGFRAISFGGLFVDNKLKEPIGTMLVLFSWREQGYQPSLDPSV